MPSDEGRLLWARNPFAFEFRSWYLALMKICNKCEEARPLGEFHREARYRDGYRPVCKHCRNRQIRDQKSRDVRRAHKKVENAVLQGKLIRPTHCERCNQECKPDAHHPDHSKPLEVEWICRSCHTTETYRARTSAL